MNSSNLYSCGLGVFRRSGDSWIKLIDTQAPFMGIYGTGEDNILAVGHNGQTFHFNGKDWLQLKQLISTEFSFHDVWCDESTAILIGQGNGKTYVYTGR